MDFILVFYETTTRNRKTQTSDRSVFQDLLSSSISLDLICWDIFVTVMKQTATFLQLVMRDRASGHNSTKTGKNKTFFFSDLVIRLFIGSTRCWQQLVPLRVLQLETAVMSATCAAITSRTRKCSEVTYICPQAHFMSYARVHREVGISFPLKPHIKAQKVQSIMLGSNQCRVKCLGLSHLHSLIAKVWGV